MKKLSLIFISLILLSFLFGCGGSLEPPSLNDPVTSSYDFVVYTNGWPVDPDCLDEGYDYAVEVFKECYGINVNINKFKEWLNGFAIVGYHETADWGVVFISDGIIQLDYTLLADTHEIIHALLWLYMGNPDCDHGQPVWSYIDRGWCESQKKLLDEAGLLPEELR